MAFKIGFGSLPEPAIDPPSLEAHLYELQDKREEYEKDQRKVENLMDAWGDTRAELAGMDAPETLTALADQFHRHLETWANGYRAFLADKLADLDTEEEMIGWPWK